MILGRQVRDRCGSQGHRHIPVIFIFRKEKLISKCMKLFFFRLFFKVRMQKGLRNII